MSDILVFDKSDNLLAILSNDGEESCQFWDAPFKEIVNNGAEFKFTAEGDHEDSQYLVAENQVAFFDKDGYLRLFVITEPTNEDSEDGPVIHIVTEPAMNELADEVIEDVRPYNTTLDDAQGRALAGTRWKKGINADLGINSVNYYYSSVLQAISDNIATWGGELLDRIEFDGNKITDRFIDILPRRGADIGKIWEIDKDIVNLSQTISSYPITALYGRGNSLQLEQDPETGEPIGGENEDPTNPGYGRKITFDEVVWEVAKGDPVDKPLGQKWVGDPVALEQFGRVNADGSKRHRESVVEFDEDDPAILLQRTWNALQTINKQDYSYKMDVILLGSLIGYEHEKVRLGDTTRAVDSRFKTPVEIEERIVAYEYDITNDDDTGTVELGSYLGADLLEEDQRFGVIERELSYGVGIGAGNGGGGIKGPITDLDIINTLPSHIEDLTAEGLFQTIMVKWKYFYSIYISAFEVYASQIQGFIPDASNLVFRGKTDGYIHKALPNETWYFRVVAKNTHGEPGTMSNEISAQTARVISDDIFFGPDIAAELKELSKTAELLSDGYIKAPHMAANSITAANGAIENLAITNGKIANLTLTTGKIQDGQITNAKISNLAVDSAKISSIDAGKINATTLAAITANLGTVTAGEIRGLYIYGSTVEGAVLKASDRGSWSDASYINRAMIEAGTFKLDSKNGTKVVSMNASGQGLSMIGQDGWNQVAPAWFKNSARIDFHGWGITTTKGTGTSSTFYVDTDWFGVGSSTQATFSVRETPNKVITEMGYNTQAFKVFSYGGSSTEKGPNKPDVSFGVGTATISDSTGAAQLMYDWYGSTVGGYNQIRMYSDLYIGYRLYMGDPTIVVTAGNVGKMDANTASFINYSVLTKEFSLWAENGSAMSDTTKLAKLKVGDIVSGFIASGGGNIYVGSDDEVRIVSRAGYNGGSITWKDVRANGHFGNFLEVNTLTSGVNLYIRPLGTGEVRVTAAGGTSTYRPIRAFDFLPPSSVRSTKKNIEVYSESALDVFRTAQIYTYNLLEDDENAFKQLGMMIDETPRVLHGQAGDSFSLYALTAYMGKGIKELITVTDLHEDELSSLKQKVATLEEEVNYLKQQIA